MSSSRNLEEAEARIKYLQTQVAQLMRERERNLQGSPPSSDSSATEEALNPEGSPLSSPSESSRGTRRTTRRPREAHFAFKVDIPKFEGKLDPDIFLEWLCTVEKIFDYKEIPEKKKVKLVALKLRKHASMWWANLVAKRARKGKDKIRSRDQVRNKLKDKFLPPHYLQDNYLKLHPKPNERMRCSRCQGLGHIASECPNKRIVTLAEYQASFGELEKEKEEEEGGKEVCLNNPIKEVKEGPDEGELLTIRRTLDQ